MWNFMWLDIDSSLQTNDSKWLDNFCDSALTLLDQVMTHNATRKNVRLLCFVTNNSGTSLVNGGSKIVRMWKDYFKEFQTLKTLSLCLQNLWNIAWTARRTNWNLKWPCILLFHWQQFFKRCPWTRHQGLILFLQNFLLYAANRTRSAGVDSGRILRFPFGPGPGPGFKNLRKTGSGSGAEVCMDWILDFLDPDSGCVQQDPDSGFLNKNRNRTGFGFCNLLMKNGLWYWAVPVIANYV